MSTTLPRDELSRRARRVRWLLSDVDGVLTDGRLYYADGGEEIKGFDVKDGLAVALARQGGLRVGILSARSSAALDRRLAELEPEAVLVGRPDKSAAFDELLELHGVTAEEVAYIGDDLTDLPVLARTGLSFAPADAALEVQRRVHCSLEACGGRGALREAVEILLRMRGQWPEVLATFEGAVVSTPSAGEDVR